MAGKDQEGRGKGKDMGMGVRRSPSSSQHGTDTESCYTHRLLLLFGWVQRLPGGGREGERGRHQAGVEGQEGARTGRGAREWVDEEK